MAGLALHRENREHHGKTLLPKAEVAEWVRVRVLRRAPRLTRVGSSVSTSWTVYGARAEGQVKPSAGASWEQHVERLWQEVQTLRSLLEQDRTEMLAKVDAVNGALTERVGKTEERITLSENAIHGMATGSFRMEVWGLVLIGLGSAVSLLPAVLDLS